MHINILTKIICPIYQWGCVPQEASSLFQWVGQ